ncbi:MAG: ribosome maturation factor RimP [Neisseria sp.]|nr:ribosome maturation factor RimP [Neisseria sp.]
MNIESLLDKTLPGLGYECVDVELTPQGTLRIFIDKPEGITVDDCALVSNHLSRLFMVEEVDYKRLEVSSPGLDRVLKKEKDFVRFAGSLARVQTRLPQNGQKKFVGRIKGFENNALILMVKDEEVMIEAGNIERARLKPEF